MTAALASAFRLPPSAVRAGGAGAVRLEPRLGSLAVFALLVAAIVWSRAWWEPRASVDFLASAPAGDPLLVARPVDANTADADVLATVPGVGPHVAAAIVADRAAHGPFARLDDLDRVKGVGPSTLDAVSPFLTVSNPPASSPAPAPAPGPAPESPSRTSHRSSKLRTSSKAAPSSCVDPNHASPSSLETLPGVGPALSARIVDARPFASADDLDRVKGIGPKTVEKLRPYVCFP